MKRLSSLPFLLVAAACAAGGAGSGEAPAPRAASPGEAEARREAGGASSEAATPTGPRVESVRVEPGRIELRVGEDYALSGLRIEALDAAGRRVEGARTATFLESRIARVDGQTLRARAAGEAVLLVAALVPGSGQEEPAIARVPVVIHPLPVGRLEIVGGDRRVYAGTAMRVETRAYDAGGAYREARVRWSSDRPEVAVVDGFGHVRGLEPGRATLTATADEATASITVEVAANPVRSLELRPARTEVRTGDVVRLNAVARDARGREVEGVPIVYAVSVASAGRFGEATPLPADRGGAGAAVYEGGAFVAERPGTYHVVAAAGPIAATATLRAEPRGGELEAAALGRGVVAHAPTSDLWVFQGRDGRDYAYTGTHAGGQKMYVWDVTDPDGPALTDSVVVDARVVNDVKVNADASLAVITREGASTRRNGIVVLDLADPAHPRVLSEFAETVTGGVHNTFIVGDLVYAVHNGTSDVHIIDISDPTAPKQAGRWGLDRPGRTLHDIWVVDGLAYVSYWDDGVWILDVGDGRWGGTPTEPKPVGHLAYPEGNTHVAFPYTNEAGHRYLFVGDEIFGCEECITRTGVEGDGSRGYIHVLDVSDPEHPVEVAKYEVPEAGAHNIWVEDDRLYAAYYQAGLRVVDVSGELRGDLYAQGRELAWFPTGTSDGFVPNSPMAWGPQPYEGNVFVSDLNSGLWVIRLQPKRKEGILP